MSVEVGKPAPACQMIALGESGPKKVSFADLKGAPALVLFFPLVNTGVCFNEMCGIRDSLAAYNGLKTRVVAVSVDAPFAQKYWAQKEGFTFEFWSDFNKEAINALGCKHDELAMCKGVAKRSAFVLDKDGVVRYASISDDPKQLPKFDEIQAVLAKL